MEYFNTIQVIFNRRNGNRTAEELGINGQGLNRGGQGWQLEEIAEKDIGHPLGPKVGH